MVKYNSYNNYNLNPVCKVSKYSEGITCGNGKFVEHVKRLIGEGNRRFVFELYPNVDNLLDLLSFDDVVIVDTTLLMLSEEELENKYKDNITDDRVFGTRTLKNIEDCFDRKKIEKIQAQIKSCNKVVFVIGVGASLVIPEFDVCYYFNINRWEIQLRYRKGASNWLFDNKDAAQLTKYKIGYFIEWRLADKLKFKLMDRIDYMVDANDVDCLKLVTKDDYISAMSEVSMKPFRMVPYFDESVWGGQWMKNMFGLPQDKANYGWAFDGVPEENSIRFAIGDDIIEFPALDIVKLEPKNVLGSYVYGLFGAEFPIRFDFLDTFEGGNLSLQVHPLVEYIQNTFGMHYTQDESYYFMDALDDGCVYLGLKPDVNPKEFEKALEKSTTTGEFDAEKFVNKIPIKKHDHILIPAGTVHCSGKNTTVLEISATTYIFTFKLWDWGRLGLDGLPRPIHIKHGMQNIQFGRDTKWVEENLINREVTLFEDGNSKIEKTGLHELEFIDTHRYTTTTQIKCNTHNSVNVINCIDGKKGYIKSINGEFEDTTINYGETFVIPSCINEYILSSTDGTEVMFMVAHVKQ